jgi:chemotaxis protein MotB
MVKRLKTNADVPPEAQWQTIYCSLALLLFVFFIMLVAYSSINRDRLTTLKISKHIPPVQTASQQNMDRAMQSLHLMSAAFGNDFTIEKTNNGFKATIADPVLFQPGDAGLGESVHAVLDDIAGIARHNGLAIQVEGHTDNVPIASQKFPSNWELSTLRAVNILRYLQSISGMPADRLIAVGYAEYRPRADNATPEGRRMNRRIEIIFRPAT